MPFSFLEIPRSLRGIEEESSCRLMLIKEINSPISCGSYVTKLLQSMLRSNQPTCLVAIKNNREYYVDKFKQGNCDISQNLKNKSLIIIDIMRTTLDFITYTDMERSKILPVITDALITAIRNNLNKLKRQQNEEIQLVFDDLSCLIDLGVPELTICSMIKFLKDDKVCDNVAILTNLEVKCSADMHLASQLDEIANGTWTVKYYETQDPNNVKIDTITIDFNSGPINI